MCHYYYRQTIAMVSGGGLLPHFHIIHTPGWDCCMNQGGFTTPFTTCFLLCLITKFFLHQLLYQSVSWNIIFEA